MLYKKNILLIALILVFVLLASGCGMFNKNVDDDYDEYIPTLDDEFLDTSLRETLLYYQDDAGYLVPVMRKIPWEEGIAKAALRAMMDTEEQQQSLLIMGLKPLLPGEAEIKGMSISEDGLAKVDFNQEVMECKDAISESNMVQGIVLTLTEFPNINRVQLLFDGKVVDKLKYGTEVGQPIGPGDPNLELGENASADGAKVTVFFTSTSASQFDYLVPVTRITSSPLITLEMAIEELISGPKEIGNLRMDIPIGTKLLGAQMDDGVTYLNFSKEFKDLAISPLLEEMIIKSIVLTARQFPEVQQVSILVDGKEYQDWDAISTVVFANVY